MIGAEPSTVNDVHDVEPEHVTYVVAVELSSPVEPTYVRPCDNPGNLNAPENVDDAVENIPLVNPIVVDVEL